MLRLLCSAAVLGSCTLAAHASAQPAKDPRVAAVLEGLRPPFSVEGEPAPKWSLLDRMAFYNVPGVSMAVVDGGKIIWAEGFGVTDSSGHDRVTDKTLFQAASISKPIAAIGIMQLVQKGTLDLDADVNTYLKSWKLPDSEFTAKEKVTLRRLLSHSAGLTVHGFAGYAVDAPRPTLPQILDGTPPSISPPVRSERAPGLGFKYSGGGTTVAQLVVADVTGVDSAEFLKKTVLEPLKMDSSTYAQPLPESLAPLASTGHSGRDAKPLEGKWHVYPMQFAAGLWTTPTDLCRMGIAVQRAMAGDVEGPLNPSLVRQMLTVTAEPVGIGYFLAGEGDRLRFSHNGGNDGFLSTFEAYAGSGKGYAIMINSDGGGAILGEISRAIKAAFEWPDLDQEKITPATLSPAQIENLTGTYALTVKPSIKIIIYQVSGRLHVRSEGTPENFDTRLIPSTPTTYVPVDPAVDIALDAAPDARVEAIKLEQGRFEAKRVPD